jgi:hypothetical protein
MIRKSYEMLNQNYLTIEQGVLGTYGLSENQALVRSQVKADGKNFRNH